GGGGGVAFMGGGPAEQEGVYLANTILHPPPILPIADTTTPMPGRSDTFTRFVPPNPIVPPNPTVPPNPVVPPNPTAPAISGQYLVFFGATSKVAHERINLADISGATPPP